VIFFPKRISQMPVQGFPKIVWSIAQMFNKITIHIYPDAPIMVRKLMVLQKTGTATVIKKFKMKARKSGRW